MEIINLPGHFFRYGRLPGCRRCRLSC
jgi:hypothetical protein